MTGRQETRARRVLVCPSCGARGRTVGYLWAVDHAPGCDDDATWRELTDEDRRADT